MRDSLTARARRAADALPPARWVRPASLHLTLRFLGTVEERALPPLLETLGQACSASSPQELEVVDSGTFPPGRPARVAWAGVRAGAGLPALREGIDRAAHRSLGLEPEAQPFHPHVTLARPRRPWGRSAIEHFESLCAGSYGSAFVAGTAELMESRLGPSGARYRIVESFPLGGVP